VKTKSYVRFLNRAVHFETDIELVDVLSIAVGRGALHTAGGEHMFDDVSARKHPRLATRPSNLAARTSAVTHLKATLFASFIKDIYEDTMLYYSDVLEAAARHGLDPGRLVGNHEEKFKANDLLSAHDWKGVVKIVSDSLFRALENQRNSRKMLEQLDSKLNLGVAPAKLAAALPYFEMRHILVHRDGKADRAFCDAYPGQNETPGVKLHLDNVRVRAAYKAIVALIEEFDSKLIAKGVVDAADCQR
jgi:hypothetical protein